MSYLQIEIHVLISKANNRNRHLEGKFDKYFSENSSAFHITKHRQD